MAEDRIAALYIGRDIFAAQFFEYFAKILHRQAVPATNVDASQQCNVGIHCR